MHTFPRTRNTVTLMAVVTTLALTAMPAIRAQDPASDRPQLRWDAARLEAFIQAMDSGLPYVPGEVLVKFQPGLEPTQQARALSVLRGRVARERQRWIGDWLLVHADGERDAERMAAALGRQAEVIVAEPNYLSRLHAVPNDTFYRDQWNLDLIKMPAAWDINPGGSADVTVAVIDTGITTVNESRTWRLWTAQGTTAGFGFFSVPYSVSPDLELARVLPGFDFALFVAGQPVLDMVGHGTHVAGTILQSTNNALGVAGISYRSRLLPLKVCVGYWDIQIVQSGLGIPGFVPPSVTGGCSTAASAEAVRYAADNGAKVINMSLGGPNPSLATLDALRYAVSRGAFVAISAGNDYEEGNPTNFPAGYATQIEGVMSVGAVGPTSRRSFYSETGTWVEIVAPGGDSRVGGTASGVVWQSGLDPRDFNAATIQVPRFDRYLHLGSQGTSMAAPHVAGLAALLYSQGITSPAAIEAAIKQFAVDLGAAGRDDEYGYGLIDARTALRGLGLAR